MKLNPYKVVFFIACAAAFFSLPQVKNKIREIMRFGEIRVLSEEHISKLDVSDRSIAYKLDSTEWIDFPVPQPSNCFRIVSNLILKNTTPILEDEHLSYALDYHFLDASGNIIKEGVYHFATKLKSYPLLDGEEKVLPSFFLSDAMVVANGRISFFAFDEFNDQNLSRVSFKIHSMPKGSLSVYLRSYFPRYENISNPSLDWLRLKKSTRERWAIGNLYPEGFLQEREKRNLLEWQWKPVGPVGIEGRDYQMDYMYHYSDVEWQDPDDSTSQDGKTLHRFHRITLPIPSGGQKLRLLFSSLNRNREDAVVFDWYGKKIRYDSKTKYSLKDGALEVVKDFDEGLLELSSKTALKVRVFDIGKDPEEEISHPEMFLRAYLGSSELPVIYSVNHLSRIPTPFRVDVRRLISTEDQNDQNTRVYYRLLSGDGSIIKKGELLMPLPLSVHDRVSSSEEGWFVSDKKSFFFLLPESCKKILLWSPDKCLFATYNRPSNLPWKTSVPFDYSRENFEFRGKSWFMLRPDNESIFRKKKLSKIIKYQFKPPVREEDVILGRYKTNYSVPSSQSLGKHILVPRDTGFDEVKDDLWPYLYSELKLGETTHITLHSDGFNRNFSPKLIYCNYSDEPFDFGVYLNGEMLLESKAYVGNGELNLPQMLPTSGNLKVIAKQKVREEDAVFYMNYCNSSKKAFLLRFAESVSDYPIHFTYRKRDEGNRAFTVVYYAPREKSDSVSFGLSIKPIERIGIGPFEDYTILNRVFTVSPSSGDFSKVLESREERVHSGQPFYFTLGSDLLPGDYEITINRLSGQHGYIQVYELMMGLYKSREVNYETDE